MKIEAQIWDWPLRLFHWLLVASVVGAYASGKAGGEWTDWHGRCGSMVLGLLVFRLLWGFVGGRHARFGDFFPTPPRLIAYLKGRWQGAGHNPLGALAVLALLVTLSALAGTGLFANDDIAFEGPLFHLIDKDFSDKLSGWHIKIVNVLIVIVGLHVGAILFYQRVKKTNLILPMLTGKKQVPRDLLPKAPHSAGIVPLLFSLLIAASTVWGVWGGNVIDYLAPLAGIQTASAEAKAAP